MRELLNDRSMMGDGVIELNKARAWVEDAGFAGFAEVDIFLATGGPSPAGTYSTAASRDINLRSESGGAGNSPGPTTRP